MLSCFSFFYGIHSKTTYFWIYSTYVQKPHISEFTANILWAFDNSVVKELELMEEEHILTASAVFCFVFNEKSSHKHMHSFKLHTHTHTITNARTHTHAHTEEQLIHPHTQCNITCYKMRWSIFFPCEITVHTTLPMYLHLGYFVSNSGHCTIKESAKGYSNFAERERVSTLHILST